MLFTILLSVITTNTSGSIVSGLVLFGVSVLMYDLIFLEELWFLPFIHWDFSSYLFGGLHWYEFASFELSLMVVLITIIIILILTYILFNRKDIKNQ